MKLIQAKWQMIETLIIMSGEIDMKKLGNKSKLTAAAMLVAAVSVAACGKTDGPRNAPMQSKAEHDAGNAVAKDGEEDFAETTLPVERRHFAIYNTYRVLFDDSARIYQSLAVGQEDGLQSAVMTSDSGMPSCSMRGMLMQD